MSDTKKKKMDREKIIKYAKTGGDILMYVGSASLMIPQIQKSKETNNGILGTCGTFAGIVLSAGLGGLASGVFNTLVDKTVDFWDDVKPKETSDSDSE